HVVAAVGNALFVRVVRRHLDAGTSREEHQHREEQSGPDHSVNPWHHATFTSAEKFVGARRSGSRLPARRNHASLVYRHFRSESEQLNYQVVSGAESFGSAIPEDCSTSYRTPESGSKRLSIRWTEVTGMDPMSHVVYDFAMFTKGPVP